MSEMVNDNINTEEAAAVERERKQFVKMTQTPIPRLIISLGIPTMLSMMVTSLYNLADTAFVSRLGDSATAAISNLLALMSVIQAIGFTYGMGSGSIVSAQLGKRDRDGADNTASSALFIALLSGVLITTFGLIFLEPLMRLFGAKSGATLQFAKDYALYILISAPFMCMSFVLNNVLRAEGKAVLSMVGLVVGAVINVVLDPILIFGAKMQAHGAGLATCVSQVISFCVLLFMFLSKKTVVRLRLKAFVWLYKFIARKPMVRLCGKDVKNELKIYGRIIVTGFPSFCRQILASVCTTLLNNIAEKYGGDAAQAALGVVNKMFMLAFSISLGIGQGYQPVLGYNHSAKRYDRVRAGYLFTLAFSTGLMILFAVLCAVLAPWIMAVFNLSPQAQEIGALTLRLQCISMPLLPLNFMAGLSYQVVGNKALASLLSISRQGLFYIPAVLLLPEIWQLFGVESCQMISDIFAFFFAIPFTIIFFKGLRKKQAQADEEKAKAQGQVCDEPPTIPDINDFMGE